jgi:oligoribonuclease NrnB/cAMP/cGMP phosphodiesterase (DHH superfamily)
MKPRTVFKELVSLMKAKDLWTDEHERLYEQMKLYELDRI